ncbi:MAG: [protein-PII] uridylyltransferase, partial [Alphaproteobacteria bacterium]|nr:[protein-PII] uridylyltransferase [Alphaproteobacteria bacterium]
RYMTGEQPLFTELHQRYGRELVAGKEAEFLVAKLAERDERHGRMGDSRYVLEPNIKDGKGGLRDLHTLFWIAKYLYGVSDHGELVGRGILTEGELKTFSRAYRFLWTLRCHLHYLAGRAEERLTFDVQPPIAEVMHYTDHAGTRGVERFMKHYYLVAKDVGDLTRIFCAAMEAEHQRKPRRWLPRLGLAKREVDGFLVDNGRVTVIADDAFEADPVRMITLFRVAQKHGFDIHPHALRLITRNLDRIDARLRADREANAAFMAMLTAESDPETTLRRMNEAGVLGRFIPDFGRVVAQTQHDMYHVYTVDEHSVFAIGVLTGIEQGGLGEELPLATEIIHEVLSRKALYLAVFLHDIAKGRGGNHSEIGARIAAKLGPRLGLRREETETVCWLVLNHLLFSNTAFKRDISDPQTVTDFVAKVQSPERLRLLLVVTVADIRAVGPNVWNGWKGQLLRDLYHEAAAVMIGGAGADERDARRVAAQARLRELLTGWSDSDVAAFLARGYPAYWLSFDPETLARHAHMMRDAAHDGRELAIESRIDRFRAVTEITVYCPDHHGLFAGVAGAIAVCGAGIAEARIFTTTDGMAIDTFWVQTADGRAFEDTIRLDRLEATIARTLSGDFKPAAALAQRAVAGGRTAVFKVVPRVLIDNRASATHTVVEINARDRVGLLHDIARTLVSLRLSIGSARIATFGERAVDVFYVKDLYGMKVIQPARIDDIRETLVAAVAEAPENAPGERAVAPAAE